MAKGFWNQQQFINTFEDVPEKAEIINIVNNLIEENGLSPAEESKASFKAPRREPELEFVAMVYPKCQVRNGSAHDKIRFRCKD